MTNKERLRTKSRARLLLNNGVPLNIDRDDEDAALLMRQIGGETESCAFDLRYEQSGYILNMGICITQSVFTISDIFLKLPWTDDGISLIDDPLASGARYGQYWFPCDDFLAFERGVVINQFVNVHRPLRRGKSIQGLLLWVGSEPIPGAFVHGVSFPASVIVLDQFDNPYISEVTFWTDRSKRVACDKRKGKSRPRLFSKRDPSPVHSQAGADTVKLTMDGK
jgi:hypothetical protein